MATASVEFVSLASRPELIPATGRLINTFWKRSLQYRVDQLTKSVEAVQAAEHWSQAKAATHFLLVGPALPTEVVATDQPAAASHSDDGSAAPPPTTTTTTTTTATTTTTTTTDSNGTSVVLGHGQLKVAAKHRQVGRACVAFSIVVAPEARGRGLGTRLLHAMEREVAGAGFSFLYLYAAPALVRGFYSKLGYRPCDAMTVKRRAFKGLRTEQLEGLEGLFAARALSASRSTPAAPKNPPALPMQHAQSGEQPGGETPTITGSDNGEVNPATTVDKAAPVVATADDAAANTVDDEEDEVDDEDPTAGGRGIGDMADSDNSGGGGGGGGGGSGNGSGRRRGGRSVWLRKRLTEKFHGRVRLPSEQETASAREIAERYAANSGRTAAGARGQWRGRLRLLPHFKQIGPSCGLCALAMVGTAVASSVDGKDKPPLPAAGSDADPPPGTGRLTARVRKLLAQAQKRGITADGEMFDIEAMAALAEWMFEVPAMEAALPEEPVNAHSDGGAAHSYSVQVRPLDAVDPLTLCAGGDARVAWIVPYDSRPGNCEPCERKGRCAHYAVVVGVLVHTPNADVANGSDGPSESGGGIGDDDVAADPNAVVRWTLGDDYRRRPGDVHVVFQHSASRRAVVVPWEQLVRSNAQLHNAIATKSQWVVPSGGPKLKGKCIEIRWA